MAIGIDGGLLAAQLVDTADDGDIAAHVAVEEGRGDAGGGLGVHRVVRGDARLSVLSSGEGRSVQTAALNLNQPWSIARTDAMQWMVVRRNLNYFAVW